MPPLVTLSCHFPCSTQRFTEGSPLTLRDDSSATWIVKKVRYVGEPVDRMCEAVRLNAGAEHMRLADVRTLWERLPGDPLWAAFDQLRTNGPRASAKAMVPTKRRENACPGPQLAPPIGPCAPLLFVARVVSNASLALTAAAEANRTLLLARIRRDEARWASTNTQMLQPLSSLFDARSNANHSASSITCPDQDEVDPPRIYTAAGLRAALASGICSRACSAARMRRRLVLQPELVRPGDPRPCLVKDAHPHCRANSGSVLLIVARWQSHLTHLQKEQPFCYLVIEKAESPLATQQGIDYVVPNRANEASSYLHFLARHYDDALPDTMVFLQDERTSKHSKDIGALLRHVHLDAAPYMPLNAVHLPFLHPQAFCHVRSCVEQSGLLRRLGSAVVPAHHMDLAYTCCAQFIVSRAAVHTHPKGFYEDLYRYTLGGTDFGQRGDSFARGECLEVLWHALFGQRRIAEPTPAARKCGHHPKLNHRCRETSGLVNGFVPANDSFWSWAAPTWQQLNAAQRAAVRSSPRPGSLFAAAVRGGHVCLGGDGNCIGGSGAGQVTEDEASIQRAIRRMESGTLLARVQALGGAQRALSTDCSVLARQDVASTRHRRFARTLRQACGGRGAAPSSSSTSSAGVLGTQLRGRAMTRRGRGRPLHHLALCALFGTQPQMTSAFLKRLRVLANRTRRQ